MNYLKTEEERMSGYGQLISKRFLGKPVAMLSACDDYVRGFCYYKGIIRIIGADFIELQHGKVTEYFNLALVISVKEQQD
jgi:hypothetical protein